MNEKNLPLSPAPRRDMNLLIISVPKWENSREKGDSTRLESIRDLSLIVDIILSHYLQIH